MNSLRAAVVIALIAAAAPAQVRETVTVEVIEVPVYVSLGDGTPVRGLTKDAFELRVNGKRHPIDYFDAIDYAAAPQPAAATAAAAAPARDPRERRLYLLLFDLAFSSPKLIDRAQKAADAAVSRSDPATDYFAVATLTRRDGVKFITAFLTDHVVIRRAIETLRAGDVDDPLQVGLSSKRRRMWAEIDARAQGTPLAFAIGTEELPSSDPEAISKVRGGTMNMEGSREPLKHDAEDAMANLGEAAKRVAALEGQKHVILFSAGWSPRLIPDLGRGYGEDPKIRRYMEEMATAFRRAGAFLDSIDIVGAREEAGAEALARMSDATGGQLVRNTNDLGEAIGRLTASQRVVYLLGFKRGDLAQGDIDVRVAGIPHGARVSFRNGFGKPAESGDINALQLADIITNDIPQNGLSAHFEVTPKAGGADIVVLFRPAEVVAQLAPASPYLDVLLYVFDEHGGTALFKSKRVPFDPKSPPEARIAGVREHAPLPPGRYTAKALLHVAGTQAVGFVKSAFVVE